MQRASAPPRRAPGRSLASCIRYPPPPRSEAPADASAESRLCRVFFSVQTHPALLSPEKFSQEKRFEQLLASLEKNKETKKRRKKRKEKEKKTPNQRICVSAPVSRMEGGGLSFGFLLKAKVSVG